MHSSCRDGQEPTFNLKSKLDILDLFILELKLFFFRAGAKALGLQCCCSELELFRSIGPEILPKKTQYFNYKIIYKNNFGT